MANPRVVTEADMELLRSGKYGKKNSDTKKVASSTNKIVDKETTDQNTDQEDMQRKTIDQKNQNS